MKKVQRFIPNTLTFINLSMGIVAILFAVTNMDDARLNLIYASLFVMFAALTDRLDGKLARVFNVSSELGKELDSLSDLISFGVAPIIIAWKINFMEFGILGYLIVLIFPIAGAYRLARYNIAEFDDFFRGIPITVAGAFLCLHNLYVVATNINYRGNPIQPYISIVLIITLSILMISKFKIKKI